MEKDNINKYSNEDLLTRRAYIAGELAEIEVQIKDLREEAKLVEAELLMRSEDAKKSLSGHGFETRLNPGKVSYAYDETAIRNGIPDSLLSTVFIPQPALFNPKVFNALLETEVINPSLANCKKQVPANPRWEFRETK